MCIFNKSKSLVKKYDIVSRVIKTEIKVNSAPQIFTAIWDTGATATVIDEQVAIDMGLIEFNSVLQYTAGGSRQARVYVIDLVFPNGMVFYNVEVSDGILYGCDILIGMDIITQGEFLITNSSGKTTMNYKKY